MRCPTCNKFVSYEGEEEPEEQSIELSEGHITADVRIHKNCAECFEELKEATLTPEADVDEEFMKAHTGKGHALEVSESNDWSATERQDNPGRPARYRRTYFGASTTVIVTCSCGATTEIEMQDETTAGGMDEMV